VVAGCAILLLCTFGVVYMLCRWCCVHIVQIDAMYMWCCVHVVDVVLYAVVSCTCCRCGVVCMWCCVHVMQVLLCTCCGGGVVYM